MRIQNLLKQITKIWAHMGPEVQPFRKHLASNPLSPLSAFHHSQELTELWRATKKEEAAELTAPLFQGACAQARPGGSIAVAG